MKILLNSFLAFMCLASCGYCDEECDEDGQDSFDQVSEELIS